MPKARIKFKLVDRDRGYRRLVKELEKAARGEAYTKVGLLADRKNLHAARGDPLDSVAIGVMMEFGVPSRSIPERSFLRRTFDNKKREWLDLYKHLVGLVYDGRITIEKTLGLLGERAAADVKLTITEGEGVPPPNAPSTLRAKEAKTRAGSTGSVRTLVDSALMVRSITHAEVIQGKEEGEEGGSE